MIEALIDLEAGVADEKKLGGACHVRITEEQNGKAVAVTEKSISVKDFLDALGKVYFKNKNVFQAPVGPFPDHTFMYCSGTRMDKILFYEPGKKRLFIQGDKPYMVHMPNVLFGMVYTGGKTYRVVTLYAWIFQGELTENTRLYEYPFGHVYSDGRVCTGNVIQGGSLHELAEAAKDVFFNAPNRGHAFRAETLFATDEFRSMSLEEVLKRAGKSPIPFSNFMPSKFKAGDVFGRIQN